MSDNCTNENELTSGKEATTIYVPVPGPQGPAGPQGPPGVGIKGPKGDPGDAAVAIPPAIVQFIYKLSTTEDAPVTPTADYLGEGWSETMLNVGPVNKYQWVSFRYVGAGMPEDFSVPALYSNYAMPGMDGVDGATIEFIYKLQSTDVVPATPVDPIGEDDHVPLGWTDNASGPTAVNQFEFFTKRLKVNGVWQAYDTPAVWAKYGANGEDGVDGKDIEFIFKRTDEDAAPATPVGDTGVDESFPIDWTDNPVSVDGTYRWQWFSKRLKVAGVWSVYSAPALWSKFALDGQDGADGKDIEWIYKRQATDETPDTPVAPDNADDWVDIANGWTDEASGVTEALPYEFASQRRKVAGVWQVFSTPALWAKWGFDGTDGQDGDTHEFIFKRTEDEIRPTTPADVSQVTGFVPSGWTDEPADLTTTLKYQWQSQRTKVNGVWGEFSQPKLVHRTGPKGADGVDGKYTQQLWAKNGSNIVAPDLTNTADFPAGWVTAPLSLEFNEYLWMTSANKNADGSLIGTWSEPVRVNGVNGSDGVDGKGIEFIFKLAATSAVPSTPVSVNEDDNVPAGWTDDQSGVSPSYPFEFVCRRKKSAGVWGTYSTPVVWAKYSADGENGVDGVGVEFIFRRAATSVPPATPPTSQTDGYVPTNWTDEMSGVNASFPYEFVSKRTKTDGVWSAFSAPKIWSQMGEKGDTVPGPAIVYRGLYSPSAVYVGDLTHIEVVKYNPGTGFEYYMTRTDAGTITAGTLPTATSKWNPFVGQFENIATGLLFAERAVVENLVVTEIQATIGKIANFNITENKLESTGAAYMSIDMTSGAPIFRLVGPKTTQINHEGMKTDFIEALQVNVGVARGASAGTGALFIDSNCVFYRHGNVLETGNPFYGGRSGDWTSNGYALLQPSALGGPKVVVAELHATELYSATGSVLTSDINLKRNIEALPYGLDTIMRMRPVMYEYDFSKSKNPLNQGLKSDKKHLGLIAQEMEHLIPELVSIDKEGEYGLNLTSVVAVLIKGMQELFEIVNTKADR